MGKATRWLKSLFGIKNTKDHSNSGDRKDKKRCSIGNSGRGSSGGLCHNPTTTSPDISPDQVVWLRSLYNETEKEQNKHAIAVAAATAAAADAAVAAAQAAVAVVRLTSHGRGSMFGDGHEKWAAVRIQTFFRGYLARKALRALKGLVKIQALVRGYLVRKQASATLQGMQALIRAQATIRSHKARKSMDTSFNIIESPKTMNVETGRSKSRSRRTNTSVSDFGYDFPLYHYQAMSNWGLTGDECRFSTAQSTPRLAPVTQSKNVCADNLFGHYRDLFPNYMANTQSSKAKLRSHSAPKQRPEPGPKKRLPLDEMLESRCSLSGVRMRRSCSQAQEAISFKNAVMGKLDRSSEFGKRC
ncbi:IQ-domain 26 [Hibiscus trionum]|uniref:IQ-domain 26 n=1 Tax=Hibiscus trionum TaxID=183268 RepID=A0A9W7I4Y4_HIBTR|nr:IQ-domain 26 [Hibiscus trionum]